MHKQRNDLNLYPADGTAYKAQHETNCQQVRTTWSHVSNVKMTLHA